MLNSFFQIIFVPEIFLAILTCVCLLIGLYSKKNSYIITINFSLISLFIISFLIFFNPSTDFANYNEFFSNSSFIQFFKLLVVIGGGLSIIISKNYFIELKIERFEIPILLMFSTLGMLMMICSNNLMSMYLSIELQSLSLYILAAVNRNSLFSAESGVKYFILGALSSGILLYGCSLIYGFTGYSSFEKIFLSINLSNELNLGLTFGLVFVLVGLAFKISAVPFHMWTL
jgi:NADH:ubiquinone oxidoreductase subunit 2 (chain N)